MEEEGSWISRNPRRSATKKNNSEAVPPGSSPSATGVRSDENKSNAGIPDLTPFLGWTKLSACHVRRPRNKRRRIQNTPNDEPLLRVTGKAIFFLHDPRAVDNNNNRTDEEENDGDDDTKKSWFQGRFFPNFGLSSSSNNNGSRTSPTSVVSVQQNLPATSSSWGLLAVLNEIEDECLLDDCGGYRELDLTIIRNMPNHRSSSSTAASSANSSKLRWTVENVEWTGGNMLRLSTDPYSVSSPAASLPLDEHGLVFEPKTLMEGLPATKVASKYFPSLVKRLQIDNLMNEEGTSSSSSDDALVIVGDMTIVAPKSFVQPQSGFMAGDEDGLWDD